MSRRKNRPVPLSPSGRPLPARADEQPATNRAAAPTPDEAPPVPRFLVGGLVALLAARSLVAGEDPSRLRVATDSSGVLLGAGAWALAVLAAVWWAWRRPPVPRGWPVLAGVALLAALLGDSALQTAGYRHAALLGGWEALLWPVLFGLSWLLAVPTAAGPLARTAADRTADRLLSAVLATTISLSAGGLLTTACARAGFLNDPPALTLDFLRLGTDEVLAPTFDPPARPGPATFLNFFRPDTLAVWLLLTVPAAFVAAAGPGLAVAPRLLLAVLGAALALAVPSGEGWLALPVAGFVAWDSSRRWGTSGPRVTVQGFVAAALSLAAGVLLAVPLGGPLARTFWAEGSGPHQAAVRMWRDGPWLGVGPGQFPSLSARYLGTEEPAPFGDAGSLLFELLAAGGALSVAAALLAAGLFIWFLWRVPARPAAEAAPGRERLAWEFYVGAAAGLLLGFVLRIFDRLGLEGPTAIGSGVLMVSLRSLVWFGAFAAFETVRWGDAGRRRVLVAGLLAVLVFGLDSSAPMLPAAAWPFWLAAGLALAGLPLPADRGETANDTFRWLAPGAVLVLAVAHAGLAAGPETLLASAERATRAAGPQVAALREEVAKAAVSPEGEKLRGKAATAAERWLLTPLGAVRDDWQRPPTEFWAGPIDPLILRPHVWAYLDDINPKDVRRRAELDGYLKIASRAGGPTGDPFGTLGLRTQLLLMIREVRKDPGLAASFRGRAREVLRLAEERDPSSGPRLRYAWADVAATGDPDEARLQALLATLADDRVRPTRRLTEEQKARLQAIQATAKRAGPPGE